MPSEINQLWSQLVQRCKEHQIQEQVYRSFVMMLLGKHPELGLLLDDELKKYRLSIQVTTDAAYHELETAISLENDVLPALRRFLGHEE